MAVNNSLSKQAEKKSFPAFMKQDVVLRNLSKTLGDETRKNRFVSSIISAVSTNTALQDCDYNTIINSALLGEALNLSPSPQLGHFYMVPFKDTKQGRTVATFQIGWKGYLQMAIRSGQYKHINVLSIKEGELIKYDPLEESIEISLIEDEEEREKTNTIGYYAMFELVNGFKKSMYWSKKKMEAHAMKYSQGYKNDKAKGTKYTFWSKSFDDMAHKTMLRQLIGKWGIMSIEMQNAFTNDMSFKDTATGESVYVDNADAEFMDASYQIKEEPATINPSPNDEPVLL